jgi:hypothetical protein
MVPSFSSALPRLRWQHMMFGEVKEGMSIKSAFGPGMARPARR